MKKERLDKILELHQKWIDKDLKGIRADLRGTDLRGADLQGANLQRTNLQGANLQEANLREANLRWADLQRTNLQEADLREANLQGTDLREADLREANLDFSVYFLQCKTLDIKVCERLPRQLAYHICRMESDSNEVKEMQELLKPFANKFHRVDECGRI